MMASVLGVDRAPLVELADKKDSRRPPAGPVPQEAIKFFVEKEIKPAFSYRDVWREEHRLAFTLAKVMEIDVLETVRASIERALRSGQTFETWAKEIGPSLDASGWAAYGSAEQKPSRLAKIFDTNMRVARAAGQWDRIDRTKKALPYLRYILGPRKKHREEHVAWANQPVVLRADDPWWDEHMPPNGYGCGCGVIQLTARQAEALGVSDSPDVEYSDWTNPATGETEQVPNGVDPGWNYNPGKERAERLEDVLDAADDGGDE
jgi:uncharacterized protein with gpF-like domain